MPARTANMCYLSRLFLYYLFNVLGANVTAEIGLAVIIIIIIMIITIIIYLVLAHLLHVTVGLVCSLYRYKNILQLRGFCSMCFT